MPSTGERDRLITVQRATVTVDEYGGEIEAWEDVQQTWARVRFGRAEEKRQAAAEGGQQSATFEIIPTNSLLAVTLKESILFDGDRWDLTEVAPLDRQTLRLTAVRSV